MRGTTLRLLINAGAQRLAAAQAAPGLAGNAAWLRGVAQLPAFERRALSTSAASGAAAPAAAQVSGDLAGVLAQVDAVVSRADAGAKDVADAAMALAYLQARADRRLWGKVFERASAAKASFDAASLAAFLWAANTAGVSHFKTTFELAGPAAKLLGSFSPAQLAVVVEALGGAGVNDGELMKAVSAHVVSKAAEFSASQLAKVLAGFAGAGVVDVALTKAVLAALAGKAGGDASAKDLGQVVWALAKMGRVDAGALGALSKAMASKLGAGDAPQDVVAAVWGFAHLNVKPDAGLLSKAAALVKGATAELSAEQQICAAWSFALLGAADKDLYAGLFTALGGALSSAPDSVSVPLLAQLAEAQLLVADKLGAQAPKLPEQVLNYCLAMHGVVGDAAKIKAGSAGAAFRAAVAAATARAGGARYKPEIAAAVAALPGATPDGLPVEMALPALKAAVLPVDASHLSSSSPRVPLGPVAARAELLKARGFAPALVPQPEFSALPDATAQAKFVLAALKAATGGSAAVTALEKKLAEPFDPYADHAAAGGPSSSSKSSSKSSSSFASGTQRFVTRGGGAPGPGAYQTELRRCPASSGAAPQRVAASRQLAALLGPGAAAASAVLGSSATAAAAAGGAAEVALITPPSIPARGQCFGYESGPGGVLVMQPPAASTAAQPGAASSSSCRAASQGGTRWAASRTDRFASARPRQQRAPAVPGAGGSGGGSACPLPTRFLRSPDGRLLPCRTTPSTARRGGSTGCAAFLSKVPRPHQVDGEPGAPGPGAYILERPRSAPQATAAVAGFRPAHSSCPSRELFSRCAGRDAVPIPGITRPACAAPGPSSKRRANAAPLPPRWRGTAPAQPGAYDLSASGALSRSLRRSRAAPLSAAAWATAGRACQDQAAWAAMPAAGFGSTSSRFVDGADASQGPGSFVDATSLAADVSRKVAAASRRGAFGSAADRFGAAVSAGCPGAWGAAGEPGPGPGAFEPPAGVAQPGGAARPSPVFASSTQRFAPPPAAPVACPELAPSCSPDDGGICMRGDVTRLGPGSHTRLVDWGACQQWHRHARRATPFGSDAHRSSGAASGAPGPGAYHVSRANRPRSSPGRAGSSFASGARRFLPDGSAATPGPGTYSVAGELARPSFNVTLDG
ncbi:hypothetical protein HT031_005269 [Scenedesmus sp. PABB004]|nr:hypothetical protein HT031_005269 [Scenedesmus sp. PABB004]